MEVVTSPGLVGLTDAKGQELPCSGVITFGIELTGRTTSVTAWVFSALRNRIIVGSGTLEDLEFSAVEEIPRWIGSDGPIEETRILGIPGLGSTVTRSTTRREDPLNLDGLKVQGAQGGIMKNLMSPFHMGWVREVVAHSVQPNKAVIYYVSPDKRTKLRSSKDAIKHFLIRPHDNLSTDNFSWKQRPLGLHNPNFETLRTAKPQQTMLLMTLEYFLSAAAVKLTKKSAGNHLFIHTNNKTRREITLRSLSICQILKFVSKRLNFSDFKD